jgi:hypothetical protein
VEVLHEVGVRNYTEESSQSKDAAHSGNSADIDVSLQKEKEDS